MKQYLRLKNIGNLESIPDSLSNTTELGKYVHGLDHEEKRRVLLDIESSMKAIAGQTTNKDGKFRQFGFDEFYDLSYLIEMRCVVLNEMMEHPTAEEVMRLKTVNDRLLDITKEMFRQTRLMRKVFHKLPAEEQKDEAYTISGVLKYKFTDSSAVSKFDNDDFYGSDFAYMLNLVSTLIGEGDYMDNFMEIYDDSEPLDDGKTWTDGYLWNEAFNYICICYAMHAVCCHMPYSIPDVLRMNNFLVHSAIEYEDLTDGYTENRNRHDDE